MVRHVEFVNNKNKAMTIIRLNSFTKATLLAIFLVALFTCKKKNTIEDENLNSKKVKYFSNVFDPRLIEVQQGEKIITLLGQRDNTGKLLRLTNYVQGRYFKERHSNFRQVWQVLKYFFKRWWLRTIPLF